jgi:hypothetical protein
MHRRISTIIKVLRQDLAAVAAERKTDPANGGAHAAAKRVNAALGWKTKAAPLPCSQLGISKNPG